MPASLHHPRAQISHQGRSFRRGLRAWLGICLGGALLCVNLAGCAPSPWDAAQTRYTDGLGRVLDISISSTELRALVAPVPPKAPVSPTASQKQAPSQAAKAGTALPAPANLNLLDYLRTTPCELHPLISEHNSSLGKFSSATTRLVYDLNFINASDRCVTRLSASHPDLARQIQDEADRKRAQLPNQLRAALLYGPELSQFWHRQNSLGLYPETLQSDLEPALKALRQQADAIKTLRFTGTAAELDLALAALRAAEGGLLLKGWMDVANQMQASNAVIDRFLAKRPLCYGKRSNPRALQLKALVENLFIGQLQPMTATLNRRTHALLPLIEQLEDALNAQEDPNYAAFIRERANLIRTARARLVSHTERLQGLLAQCQLAPGQG